MAQGTILGTTNNEYIIAKIEWSSERNYDLNSSLVTAALYYKRTNEYTTYGTGNFIIYIGSTDKGGGSKSVTITDDGWVKAAEYTTMVHHNSDGYGEVEIRATGGIPGTTFTSTSISGTVILDTISRASTISSASNTTLGQACYVKWTPLSKAFRYKLTFSLASWSYTTDAIHPNQLTDYTYSMVIPLEVANQLPTAKTGTMTVALYTYSNSGATTQVGSASLSSFTVTVPENESTKPTVSMSLAPSSSLSAPYNSLYIQGLSKVKATLSFDTQDGATVVASNILVNGISYAYPYESGILTQSGKVTVKATVKDSRGYYGTIYKEIDVIPYSKPYVRAKSGESSIVVARCDASANLTDSGTYLKIKAKAVYSKVVANGTQLNYGILKFRYRKEGGTYSAWQTILNCETDKSDEVITPPLLNGALDLKSNYQVQIVVSDDFYDSAPYTTSLSSDAVYMDRPAGGKSMGLGGYSTGDGRLDVYWKTVARNGLSMIDEKGDEIPLGTTMPIPRDQIKGTYDPDNLDNGIHVIANNNALKTGDTVIMYNGLLIQMPGTVDGSVKLQLALPVDENRNPMYRLCWYSNWSSWRSMKL